MLGQASAVDTPVAVPDAPGPSQATGRARVATAVTLASRVILLVTDLAQAGAWNAAARRHGHAASGTSAVAR